MGSSSDKYRLRSLDTLRGLTVILMIVVNASTVLNDYLGYQAFGVLLHAKWAGFTFADAVFPCFIFMVGVSVAYALNKVVSSGNVTWQFQRGLLFRTLRLFILGVILFNLDFILSFGESERGFRLLGVLQRIAVCFIVASLVYIYCKRQHIIFITFGLLSGYWLLLYIPRPDGIATDLNLQAANIVSWFDVTVLGSLIPKGMTYDPEGLLSTLPAIAQCLMGLLVGDYMQKQQEPSDTIQVLAVSSVLLVVVGILCSPIMPIVKPLWTPTYVMVSSGAALLALVILYVIMDVWRKHIPGESFAISFGVNAIFVYGLHIVCMSFLAMPFLRNGVYQPLIDVGVMPQISTLVATLLFVFLLWLPLLVMYKKRIIIKI